MIEKKDRSEFIGQIIDMIEDFLDEKEPRGTEEAYIQGEWYDLLAGRLANIMENWSVFPAEISSKEPQQDNMGD